MRSVIAFAIIAGVALAASAAGSSAASASSSGAPSGSAAPKKEWKNRVLEVKNNGDVVQVTSVAGTATSRTFSSWAISTARGGDLRIRSTYRTIDKTDSSKEAEKSSFMSRFSAIIEYLDKNANGQYDDGEGLQIYRIGTGTTKSGVLPKAPIAGQGVDWTRTYTPATTPDGIYSYSAKTVDGVFEVSVKFSSATKTIDGAIVPPTAIKFNVNINLPATWYNDTTGKSRIALLARVQSASAVVTKDVDASVKTTKITKSIAAGDNSMAWADTISADGKDVAVLTAGVTLKAKLSDDVTSDGQNGNTATDRPETSEPASFVIFSFDATQPKALLWDPTIGLDPSVDSSTSSASSIAVSALALIVLIATALFA